MSYVCDEIDFSQALNMLRKHRGALYSKRHLVNDYSF